MSERPLSPHLQVYHWALTMTLSILHRITGAALAVGLVMVVWMLLAAASGEASFMQFQSFITSTFGRLMLFGWSVALFYHAANGIRHLFWDMGKGYEIKTAFASGWAVLLVTVMLTGAVWLPIFVKG